MRSPKRWLFSISLSLSLSLLAAACGEDAEDTELTQEDVLTPEEDAGADVDSPDGATDADPDGATPKPDTGPPKPGEFGSACGDNADCESGYCVQSYEGFACTKTCVTDCPDGFSCKSILNTFPDVVFICVPNVLTLCLPCESDLACSGGRCLPVGDGEERFCTADCSINACPTGFTCTDVEDDDGFPVKTCLPDSGTCDCSAANEGQVRACSQSNEAGTCPGFQTCQGGVGWSDCTAPTPMAEICDGLDNDCDGKLDEDVGDGEACTVQNDTGACAGTLVCFGQQGPLCSAPEPSAEVCDYKDNDCDGQTDEEFKDPEGNYASALHCGECGNSCQNAVANAVSTCDSTSSPPKCVVQECLSGYYKVNDFLCSPIPGKLCDPCVADTDCIVDGSKCVTVGDGQFCAVPCTDGACPNGFSCGKVDGSDVCTPTTGSCSCEINNLGFQKGCTLTWQDPSDPDAPVVTCKGFETCTEIGWSSCQAVADVCDGVDNDCDGVIDGPWVDGNGRYISDQHCGVCGNNCAAAPPANANGVCNTGPAIPTCAVACKMGWVDVNGNPADGCECKMQGFVDTPDGTDQNCDGVDGEVNNAIFVAKTGDDTNEGTIGAPLLTLQAGIDRALTEGKRDVYVATGVYNEAIVLAPGTAIYGGYRGDFRDRNTTLYETAILGPPPTSGLPGTVNAPELDKPNGPAVVLDGFTIFGYDQKTPGASSYAIWASNPSSQLTIRNNRIRAGSGGNGAPGQAGGSGSGGVAGFAGKAAYDIGDSQCGTSDHSAGGNGGIKQCGGVNVSGGTGGTAVCPKFDEGSPIPACPAAPFAQTVGMSENGQSGKGPQAGSGGAAGRDSYIDALYGPHNNYACQNPSANNCSSCQIPSGQSKGGAPGQPGDDGDHGDAGGGCMEVTGAVVGHVWVPGGGAPGASGDPGGGGGGGGAAGGVETRNCTNDDVGFTDIGGSGGGGGSGGCGGTGGQPGTGGGGSFAIFLSWSGAPSALPTIAGNVIIRSNGGAGGNGGPGGVGGPGGNAGAGGPDDPSAATFCTAGGGEGGPGGNGGHGGGGGGGCGGVSYGIFTAGGNGASAWKSANTFNALGTPGLGGFGGASVGEPGAAGQDGAAGNTNF